MPREKFAEAWQTIVGQAGPFKAVTSVRVQPVHAQGVHLVVLTTAFEKTPLDIQIAFNDRLRRLEARCWSTPARDAQAVRTANHLSIAGEGRSMPEEYLRPGHVDPQVVSDVAEWVSRN